MDAPTIISGLSAAASWAAVAVMLAQIRANRQTPPPGAPVTPSVRKARRKKRLRPVMPRQIGAAR